jgi:hypothetical protein
MSNDRTILRPPAPRFAIRETAYARVSATKGYVEPLVVTDVVFDPGINGYLYTFSRYATPEVNTKEKLRTQLREDELITLCEALDLQITELQRELTDAENKQVSCCPTVETQPSLPAIEKRGQATVVPQPRFGFNQVVYLKDTALSVGRLEAYRIDGMYYNNNINQWVYVFYLKKTPSGGNIMVGDRDNLKRTINLEYPESELLLVCEALPLVVSFLRTALNRAVTKKAIYCPSSSGSV